MQINNNAAKIVEYVEYPFAKGSLTSNGVQYSATADTTTTGVYVAIETATINPPSFGKLLEAELGLAAAIRCVATSSGDIQWVWQGRNSDATTWQDLFAAVTSTDIGTTEDEFTYSGRVVLGTTSFDKLPFQVRLVIQSNVANDGRARTKNSSYIRIKYAGG